MAQLLLVCAGGKHSHIEKKRTWFFADIWNIGLVIISLGVGLAFEIFSPKAVDPIIDFLETELKDCNGFPDKAESSSNGIQISPRIAGSDSPSTAQIWEEEPTAAEQMDAWVVLLIGKDDGIMHHSWM